MNNFKRIAPAVALILFSINSAVALVPGDRVSNFMLPDIDGKMHELYKLSDKKAIVFMTQGNGCPIVRLAVPELREIRDKYQARGVEFFLLNPNLQDTPKAVADEAKEYEFGFPIWMDSKQTVGEALGVTRTAEVFVVDPKTWKLVYHGPIDDRLSYEKQHPVKYHYLADALDAELAGKPVAVTSVNSPGCLINFPNRQTR
jgi:peroxiredoxin